MPRAAPCSLLLYTSRKKGAVDFYCAGPTAALTFVSTAAPPSATLPLVSSAAWSMTSIETGGASTPSLPAASSTFSAASTLAAAAASSTFVRLNSGKLRSDLFFHTASPCVRDMSLRLVRRASLTRNETRGPEGTVVSRRASRLVPGVS